MTKSVAALLGAAALALSVTVAAAEDMNSANYVMRSCQDFVARRQAGFGQGNCSGTIAGIAFMGMALSRPGRALPDDIREDAMCIALPAGVTLGQVVRVVTLYIEAMPQRLHEPFDWLALEALRTSWLCWK